MIKIINSIAKSVIEFFGTDKFDISKPDEIFDLVEEFEESHYFDTRHNPKMEIVNTIIEILKE